MAKRKLLLVAMSLCMVAILAMGTTLAYLTDTESATNVFTIGNVDIQLNDEFVQESKLLPGIDVSKVISVTNVGTENAFVRVHIALPTILDSGDPDYASYANKLHWNFAPAAVADGQWNYNTSDIGTHSTMPGWPGNSNMYGEWHTYLTTVDGVEYTVYVATYETALEPDKTTETAAMYKVYLDVSLDNEDLAEITKALTTTGNPDGEIKILVAAEGVQEAGFEGDPFAAFKAASDPTANDATPNLPYKSIFQSGIEYDELDVKYDNESYTAPAAE